MSFYMICRIKEDIVLLHSRGRVINCSFEFNRLEYNDANLTGSGEIAVSYASNNTVYSNIIKPNKKNVILYTDPAGSLKNVFDYQVYYPNGSKATGNSLIFNWGDQEYDGLSVFQKATKQEMHATVITGKGRHE